MSLIQMALKRWPALPYLGFGFWLAWSVLAYSGGVWLSDVESSGENISKLFITSSITFAITALIAACNSARAVKLIQKKSFLFWVGVAGAIGSLLIILSGSYYIAFYIGTDAYVIFFVGGLLAGLSSSALLLRCGMLYGVLTPRRVLLYASLSHLLLACAYYIVMGIPPWAPVVGGPPISGIIALVLALPMAAGMFSLADARPGLDEDFAEVAESRQLDIEPAFSPTTLRKLPPVFWKALIVLLVFSTVIFMMRAVVVELHPVEATLRGSSFVMLLRLGMAMIFIAVSLGFGSRRLNFGKIYSLIAVVLVMIIALLPTLGVLDFNWNLLISAAIMLFEFIIWCLLVFISYQSATSPVLVMGFGYGIYMLGNTAGWFLGSFGLPQIIENPVVSIFYISIAGVVLLMAFLLFPERDFERLFTSASRNGLSLSELMQEDGGLAVVEGDQEYPEGGQDAAPRRGRFAQQLADLAEGKGLSPRESEVLRFLAMGRSSDFISEQLSISWNTARTHIHNVYVKLDVHSRQELIDLVDSLMAHAK